MELRIGFKLLTYNNIFIPITIEESKDLIDYELECRKKDDMDDVYRNLTLLSPIEYKEFLEWRNIKEESEKNINLLKNNDESETTD